MSGSQTLLFVIIGRNEPLYEAEFHKRGSAGRGQATDSVTRQNYFVLHSALDLVEKAGWTTNSMYLKVVDKVSITSFLKFVMIKGIDLTTGFKNLSTGEPPASFHLSDCRKCQIHAFAWRP